MEKGKPEWSATLICEIVFGIIGTVFFALGAIFGIFIDEIAASPYSRGNVYLLPGIFCAIGGVCILVFAVLFLIMMRQKRNRKRLVENGSYIKACVTEIKQNHFVQINSRHPYYVTCEAVNPYTGEIQTFKSFGVLEKPSHLPGQYLRVFLDERNPKNYYVEISRNDDH